MTGEILRDNFFIIDTENLADVQTHLYGYCFVDGMIVEYDNLNESNFVPSGVGTYVYIKKTDDTISIYQDLSGSYGLYIYRYVDNRGGNK